MTRGVVWTWRRSFGVGDRVHTTAGSRIAIRGAAIKGAAALKVKEWTDEERDAKAALAKRLDLRPGVRWTSRNGAWTARELKLLGTEDDEKIAKRIGRTVIAVRFQREWCGIPKCKKRQRGK